MKEETKGLLLAGGRGTRLSPVTSAVSKHLLPVFDKPLIYYSLSNLMLAGAREIGIVCNPSDIGEFNRLLGDGSNLGISLTYISQESAGGIPHAIASASQWISSSALLVGLGDNIYFGSGLSQLFENISGQVDGAAVLLKDVHDPHRFGVAELDGSSRVIGIEEKPSNPRSNLAVTGMYFLDSTALTRISALTPSSRGELEMADLLSNYMATSSLAARLLPRGTFWLDAGTYDALLDAGNFVRSVQTYTGNLVGSPHEVAWRQGWLDGASIVRSTKTTQSPYTLSLEKIIRTGAEWGR